MEENNKANNKNIEGSPIEERHSESIFSNKRNVFIFAASLLAIAVLASSLTYFVLKNSNRETVGPQPTNEESTDSTGEDSTFKSFSIGRYSFKYPSHLKLKENNLSDVSATFVSNEYTNMELEMVLKGAGFEVECVSKNAEETITIDQHEVTRTIWKGTNGESSNRMCTTDTSNRFVYVVTLNPDEQNADVIAFSFNTEGVSKDKAVEVFNNILSTLEFTNKQTQVPSDWQVYENQEHKISFKYPSGWSVSEESVNKEEITEEYIRRTGLGVSKGEVLLLEISNGDYLLDARVSVNPESENCGYQGAVYGDALNNYKEMQILNKTAGRLDLKNGKYWQIAHANNPLQPIMFKEKADLSQQARDNLDVTGPAYNYTFCGYDETEDVQFKFSYKSPDFTDEKINSGNIDMEKIRTMDKILTTFNIL